MRRWLWLAVLVGCQGLSGAVAAEMRLVCDQPWSCVFAGSEVELQVRLLDADKPPAVVSWTLAVEQRTLAAGEAALEGDEPAATLRLVLPPLKPGVVMDARLIVTAAAPESNTPAILEKPLYLFAPEVFSADQARWKSLEIALFDPAKTTSDVLVKAGLPVRTVRTTEALAELAAPVILIGEGVSADRYANLPQVLWNQMKAGRAALCLAPAGGRWKLPQAIGDDLAAASIQFERGGALRRLDKRLDTTAWLGAEQPIIGGLTPEVFRGQLNGKFSADAATWPWVEVRGESGGRMVLCGYGVMQHWNTSPVPRYLLARWLEELADQPATAAAPAGTAAAD